MQHRATTTERAARICISQSADNLHKRDEQLACVGALGIHGTWSMHCSMQHAMQPSPAHALTHALQHAMQQARNKLLQLRGGEMVDVGRSDQLSNVVLRPHRMTFLSPTWLTNLAWLDRTKPSATISRECRWLNTSRPCACTQAVATILSRGCHHTRHCLRCSKHKKNILQLFKQHASNLIPSLHASIHLCAREHVCTYVCVCVCVFQCSIIYCWPRCCVMQANA